MNRTDGVTVVPLRGGAVRVVSQLVIGPLAQSQIVTNFPATILKSFLIHTFELTDIFYNICEFMQMCSPGRFLLLVSFYSDS